MNVAVTPQKNATNKSRTSLMYGESKLFLLVVTWTSFGDFQREPHKQKYKLSFIIYQTKHRVNTKAAPFVYRRGGRGGFR